MESVRKETLFKLIDDLVDSGIDITNIRKELPAPKYEAIRKQFARVFGSYNQGLIEYGYYASNGIPTDLEIYRCFEISERYEVVPLVYQVSRICDLYFLTDTEFKRISRRVVEDVWTDAIDAFYHDSFPFEVISVRDYSKAYPHLRSRIEKRYGSFKNMLTSYKTPYEVFVDRSCGRNLARYGNVFERKLDAILRSVYGELSVKSDAIINKCRPDFVINEQRWVDAKLSRNTIRDPRCGTLTKYLKQTDKLTVYFARGDRTPFDIGECKVRHVSALYPLLKRAGREDLISDMDAFIALFSGDRISEVTA